MTLTESRPTVSPDGATRPEAEVELLFKEARRRRRRRLHLIGCFVILLASGTSAVLSFGRGGGRAAPGRSAASTHHPRTPPSGPRAGSRATTASITLPHSSWVNNIAVLDGRITLMGQIASSNGEGACSLASVNLKTLEIGPMSTGSCGDPRLTGEDAVPAVSYDLDSNNASLAITHVDPHSGAIVTGPAVMTFGHYSDTNPVTAYGPGTLWIYEEAAVNGPEILQVDTASGQVESATPAPQLYRPLLAADDDGLWIGNSLSGSSSPWVLYHLAPGATAVTGVVAGEGKIAFWLTASGHHVWSGIGDTYREQTIWRFDGPGATPAFHTPDQGYDPSGVIGSESEGLWATVPLPTTGYDTTKATRYDAVLSINPNTGAEHVVTKLSPLGTLESEELVDSIGQTGVVFDGSLYLLKPPFRVRGYLGYNELVRVTP
jgi:hypothetical protein